MWRDRRLNRSSLISALHPAGIRSASLAYRSPIFPIGPCAPQLRARPRRREARPVARGRASQRAPRGTRSLPKPTAAWWSVARAEHAPQLLYFQARRLTADAAISSTSLAGVAPSRATSRAVPARPRQSIVPSAKDRVDQSSSRISKAVRRSEENPDLLRLAHPDRSAFHRRRDHRGPRRLATFCERAWARQ